MTLNFRKAVSIPNRSKRDSVETASGSCAGDAEQCFARLRMHSNLMNYRLKQLPAFSRQNRVRLKVVRATEAAQKSVAMSSFRAVLRHVRQRTAAITRTGDSCGRRHDIPEANRRTQGQHLFETLLSSIPAAEAAES